MPANLRLKPLCFIRPKGLEMLLSFVRRRIVLPYALVFSSLWPIYSYGVLQEFSDYGIIHNLESTASQTLALGVNKEGHLNTPRGSGVPSNNAHTLNSSGAVGLAYSWSGGGSGPSGWYDGIAYGGMQEGWGASAIDVKNIATYGAASVDSGGIVNVAVKNFVVDSTSVKSTTQINDSVGIPMLEISHLYSPTTGSTNATLFQALVVITNISGATLRDVRYRRTVDWDLNNNTTAIYADQSGAAIATSSTAVPKIIDACSNGTSTPNPLNACVPPSATTSGANFTSIGPDNLGSSITFQFGDLKCNESVAFYVYYGAGSSKAQLTSAFTTVGASAYSLGYDPAYPTLAYGFGFKGISGAGLAPTLPTKTTALPSGTSTDPTVWQTTTAPIIASGMIYQPLFKYQPNQQWIGEIKAYKLDAAGDITSDAPITAQSKLALRAASSGPYLAGGRSIWTVGYDPACMSSALPLSSSYDNFTGSNISDLQKLIFNCQKDSNLTAATGDLINFGRGLDSYLESSLSSGASSVRPSVLGDTFHSEIIWVGAPNATWTSDTNNFIKSDAYFRYTKNYADFVSANASRRNQLYVGANDGMLHAFDEDLNERWAFIPPSVLPNLRQMIGVKGTGAGTGSSNSIYGVDGPITVRDVFFYGEEKWKTVLIAGLGWGGSSYFALDITDPDNPKHLFTFNNDIPNKSIQYWNSSGTKSSFAYNTGCSTFDYSSLGNAFSRPIIMLLPYNSGSIKQKWVAVFGGGFSGGASMTTGSNVSAYGAAVYVLDLEPDVTKSTGTCGAVGSGAVTSTGGHLLQTLAVGNDTNSDIPNGVPSDLTVITGDTTSLANYYYGGLAYFSDLQGKLWKLNLSKQSLTDNNSTLFSMYRTFLADELPSI